MSPIPTRTAIDWPELAMRLAGFVVSLLLVMALGAWVHAKWTAGDIAKLEAAVASAKGQTAEVRAAWANEKAAVASATLTESNRQQETLSEVQRLATVSRAHRDADARVVAAGSMRSPAVAYAAGPDPGSDSTAAGGRTPTADRAAVLAELFAESDERAGRLAIYADQLQLASATCEAAYFGARGEAHASAPGRLGDEGQRGDR